MAFDVTDSSQLRVEVLQGWRYCWVLKRFFLKVINSLYRWNQTWQYLPFDNFLWTLRLWWLRPYWCPVCQRPCPRVIPYLHVCTAIHKGFIRCSALCWHWYWQQKFAWMKWLLWLTPAAWQSFSRFSLQTWGLTVLWPSLHFLSSHKGKTAAATTYNSCFLSFIEHCTSINFLGTFVRNY